MAWIDIAMIAFACTAANHMGFVDAMEKVLRHKLPVVNCCKCSTFWATLLYGTIACGNVIAIIAVSFLASLCAVWLELLLGYIDTLYYRAYGKIYDKTAVTAADRNEGDTGPTGVASAKDTMPEVRLRDNSNQQ